METEPGELNHVVTEVRAKKNRPAAPSQGSQVSFTFEFPSEETNICFNLNPSLRKLTARCYETGARTFLKGRCERTRDHKDHGNPTACASSVDQRVVQATGRHENSSAFIDTKRWLESSPEILEAVTSCTDVTLSATSCLAANPSEESATKKFTTNSSASASFERKSSRERYTDATKDALYKCGDKATERKESSSLKKSIKGVNEVTSSPDVENSCKTAKFVANLTAGLSKKNPMAQKPSFEVACVDLCKDFVVNQSKHADVECETAQRNSLKEEVKSSSTAKFAVPKCGSSPSREPLGPTKSRKPAVRQTVGTGSRTKSKEKELSSEIKVSKHCRKRTMRELYKLFQNYSENNVQKHMTKNEFDDNELMRSEGERSNSFINSRASTAATYDIESSPSQPKRSETTDFDGFDGSEIIYSSVPKNLRRKKKSPLYSETQSSGVVSEARYYGAGSSAATSSDTTEEDWTSNRRQAIDRGVRIGNTLTTSSSVHTLTLYSRVGAPCLLPSSSDDSLIEVVCENKVALMTRPVLCASDETYASQKKTRHRLTKRAQLYLQEYDKASTGSEECMSVDQLDVSNSSLVLKRKPRKKPSGEMTFLGLRKTHPCRNLPRLMLRQEMRSSLSVGSAEESSDSLLLKEVSLEDIRDYSGSCVEQIQSVRNLSDPKWVKSMDNCIALPYISRKAGQIFKKDTHVGEGSDAEKRVAAVVTSKAHPFRQDRRRKYTQISAHVGTVATEDNKPPIEKGNKTEGVGDNGVAKGKSSNERTPQRNLTKISPPCNQGGSKNCGKSGAKAKAMQGNARTRAVEYDKAIRKKLQSRITK